MKASERVYRWLLRLYPRDFRDEYGHEMSLLFRDRAADGRLRLWLQVLGDFIFHAPREHWHGIRQDVGYAVRQVRRSPGFSTVVVATLAVGIGGTTAMFSVTHAVLMAPLPFAQPGQLVRLYQQEPGEPATRRDVSAPHFQALRDEAASFTDVSARYFPVDLGLDIVTGGNPQRLRVLLVTSDYFHTLRAGPALGPGFRVEDETGRSGDEKVGARRVVLSEAVWRARLNSDPSVIGRPIRLSGEPYEVAGIAPEGFTDPVAGPIDAWLPYNLTGDTLTENYSLVVIGRLRQGQGIAQAVAELGTLSESMRRRWPAVRASTLVPVPLRDDVAAPARDLLYLLLLAVGLVLAVACVNVTNLMLVRATGRSQEFGVRAALGSTRSRLVRQLIVESAVLAGCGGLVGLVFASLGVSWLETLGREALPRLDAAGVDPLVLLVAAAITIGTALACGIAPALRLAQSDPQHTLTQRPRSVTGGRRERTLRNGLAATQLALALTLMTGAAAVIVSFYKLMNVDLGFRVNEVLTFEINLPSARYDAARRAAFHEELAKRLATVTGATAVGGTSRLPAAGSLNTWPIAIETGPLAGTRIAQAELREHRVVSGDFFRALEIPVLAGRTFDGRDDLRTPMRAVVSARLARTAFPGMTVDRVIGQRIAVLNRQGSREIIGVVGDVAVDVSGTASAAVYTAHRQFADNRNWTLTQVITADRAPEQLLPAVRAVVASMDPELVVHRPAPLAEIVGRGTSRARFALMLMGAFATISLLLAAIGFYGVVAYAVRQRTPEIGIRIALGATATDIRATVFKQAGVILGAGLVAGIAGALVIGQWLTTLVFGISPSDPRIIVGSAMLLLATGVLSTWLPARRAGRVSPRIAMQEGS